jgi:chromosome segregation ATPase
MLMDKKQLERQRKEAEDNFNTLQNQKTEYQNKINEIDVEMVRLQGEYRVLGKLLGKPEKVDTIDVTDVKGA